MTSPSAPTPEPRAERTASAVTRNRLLAVAVLLLVAIVGGLSALAFERLAWHHRPGPGRPGFGAGPGPGSAWHRPSRERFAHDLGLSAEQQARIDSLMRRQVRELRVVRERVQPEVDSIVARTRREIDAILTPEQREKARAFAPRFGGRDRRAWGSGPGRPGPGPDMGPFGDEPPAPDQPGAPGAPPPPAPPH